MIRILTALIVGAGMSFCITILAENGMWIYLGGVILLSLCLGFLFGLEVNLNSKN